FGHRVVLDLYPLTPLDPLMALLEENRSSEIRSSNPPPEKAAEARPERKAEPRPPEARGDPRRKITIAIDPGHGGEDPGAIGRRGTNEKHVVLAIAKKLKAMVDAEPGMRAML